MSVFAIADLHLSLGEDKPMDVFSGWDNYLERLEKNWRNLITDDDIVVIAGDVSWAMSLEEAVTDFAFLDSLPGKKLILKGNHDYWWTTRRKMDNFFKDHHFLSLQIIHNDAVAYDDFAICGSRGWFFDAEEGSDNKIILREAGRIRASIVEGKKMGLKPIVFLHYPPYYGGEIIPEIWNVLKEEQVECCYYGHVHGSGINKAFNGNKDDIHLQLISCDALQFCPIKIS